MKAPTASEKRHMDRVRQLPCLVCRARSTVHRLLKNADSARKAGPETLRQQRPALTTTRKDRAMAAMPLPSQELLRQLFVYDADNGTLIHTGKGDVPACPMRSAGRQAFQCKTSMGYYRGGLLGRNVMAHRVIWKWHFGTEPDEIDHIDGNRGNNKIENLRAASRQDNVRNTCIRKTNKTGVQGVYFGRGRFIAHIRRGGRQVELGRFKTLEEAARCRKRAEVESGYHPNHGRPANG